MRGGIPTPGDSTDNPDKAGRRATKGRDTMSFFEKGAVRIHYEEAGAGFPLLLDRRRRAELEHLRHYRRLSALQRHQGVRRRVPLHRLRPAQCPARPILRPARDRPPLGFPHRRPTRADGSSRLRQIHGAGFLHRRSADLESDQARAGSRRGGRAGDAVRLASRNARPVLRQQHEGLGAGTDQNAGPTSRWRWPRNS